MTEPYVNPAADASLTAAPAPVLRPEHAEGNLARLIEQCRRCFAPGAL